MQPGAKQFFQGRTAVIATMHRKESVIAPLLKQALGVQVKVPPFDTDAFGTFTRDVARPDNQRATARLKAQTALAQTGETLAIASEGTFGPHPALPWLPCDRELVLLLDLVNNLEIVGEELTTQTNHAWATVKSVEAAQTFAQKIGFPDHGLVVMTDRHAQAAQQIVKGIITAEHLREVVAQFLAASEDGTIHLETDMRAMVNPTRMQAIARATADLISNAQQQCPQCSRPGFAIANQYPGLPCGWCGQPTSLIRSVVYQCGGCDFLQKQQYPQGITTADPAYCQFCNP